MSKALKPGDRVTWRTSQGTTEGVVEKKVVAPMTIKSHRVSASKHNPEYLVRSDKSGGKAAHKPGSLKKA